MVLSRMVTALDVLAAALVDGFLVRVPSMMLAESMPSSLGFRCLLAVAIGAGDSWRSIGVVLSVD
jgi:hypothetical protein